MGSGDRAINEKSWGALALPRSLTLEAVCLYKDDSASAEVFERNAIEGRLPI